MKLIDKQNRYVLGEGRNYQMGFAFLKKVKQDFHTVQPISPCKDYLNDVVWAERTGNNISAYGLSYKKQDIFDGKIAYMVISIMPNFSGSRYSTQDKDEQRLDENYKLLEEFINYFEDKLKLKDKSTIEKVEFNKYLITFPDFWCRYTYLISLYSLLLRVGQFWKGKGNPLKYLETFADFQPDVYLIKDSLPKLKKLIKSGEQKHDMESLGGGVTVHNHGIISHAL